MLISTLAKWCSCVGSYMTAIWNVACHMTIQLHRANLYKSSTLSSQGMCVEYLLTMRELMQGKVLELLSHDAYLLINDTVFGELSATLFLSHTSSLYLSIPHSPSLLM